MRILSVDEATVAGAHVRIELNANRTELQIGTTLRNRAGFAPGAPVYMVDRERTRCLRSLATAVDYYAKVNRVSSDVTASAAVMTAYRMKPGATIKGDI